MASLSDEERSKLDAAVSQYIGNAEAEIEKLRQYVSHVWNTEPDVIELTHQVFTCKIELEFAYTDFEIKSQ